MMSMTGFASLSAVVGSEQELEIYCTGTLKSVNSRYFEAQCKLHPLLQVCEIDIINLLRKNLVRGKCSISLTCSHQTILKEQLKPHIDLVQSYLQAMQDIQDATGIQGSLSISDIAQRQEFFSNQDMVLSDAMKADILRLVDRLIEELTMSRHKEGLALQQDILGRIESIKDIFKTIQHEAHRCFEHKQTLINQQLEQLSLSKETEVIRYQLSAEAMRNDVTEEIVRFSTHLQSLLEITQRADMQKGKQIDFILQELGREINTIAAKSSSALLSGAVISIKVELEKIREQVQNIV